MRLVARPLTDHEMSLVLAKVNDPEYGSTSERIHGVLTATYGSLMGDLGWTWENCPMFRAIDFAIESVQWSRICDGLMQADAKYDTSPDRQVAVMMEWLNSGPSVMDEQEVEQWESNRVMSSPETHGA